MREKNFEEQKNKLLSEKTRKQGNKQTKKQTSRRRPQHPQAGGGRGSGGSPPAFLFLFCRRIYRPIGCRRIATSRRLVPSTFSQPGGPIRDWITDNGTSPRLVAKWAQSGGHTTLRLVAIRAQSGGFWLVGKSIC